MNYMSVLKALFKEPPSLEDYIASHEPHDIYHVEYLTKQYDRVIQNRNYWGHTQ